MRRLMLVLSVAAFAGCSIFGGSRTADPTAGWAGVWIGQYRSTYGGSGRLEMDLGTDTAAALVGTASFELDYRMQEARLDSLVLTVDSMRAAMRFDGLRAEIVGKRLDDNAEGTYSVRPNGGGNVVDAGSWTLTRQVGER